MRSGSLPVNSVAAHRAGPCQPFLVRCIGKAIGKLPPHIRRPPPHSRPACPLRAARSVRSGTGAIASAAHPTSGPRAEAFARRADADPSIWLHGAPTTAHLCSRYGPVRACTSPVTTRSLVTPTASSSCTFQAARRGSRTPQDPVWRRVRSLVQRGVERRLSPYRTGHSTTAGVLSDTDDVFDDTAMMVTKENRAAGDFPPRVTLKLWVEPERRAA